MAKQQLHDGNDEGSVLGGSSADLIGMHGVVVAQAANITTAGTTGATTTTDSIGYTTTTQANAIVTAVNSIIVALRAKGIISSS